MKILPWISPGAGSKIDPDFGAQTIQTTGNVVASAYFGDGSNLSLDLLNDDVSNNLHVGDNAGFTQTGTFNVFVGERSGLENGRVYHISFDAEDGNGGICSGTVTVGVPHDKKDTPFDDGPLHDSTS